MPTKPSNIYGLFNMNYLPILVILIFTLVETHFFDLVRNFID